MADGTNDIRPAVAREIESISTDDEGQNTTFNLRYLEEPLNDAEMEAIAEALCSNSNVVKVNLCRSLRGSPAEATSTFLNKILATHPSLSEIYISDNNLHDNIDEVIGPALKSNTSLQVLDLSGNDIGPHGAAALAEGLCCNKSLRELGLYNNQVGDRGAIALGEALRTNKTLETLYLDCNKITGNGGKNFASALGKSSLKELRLDENDLGDEGGKAVAESLCNNKSLTTLDLYDTNIGDETCKAVAAALCNNSSMEEINLGDNERITDVGAAAIEDTLKHLNYSVENIDLSFLTGVTDNTFDQIHHLCRRNIRLNTFFQRTNQNIPATPLGVWPRVLEVVECKPDLIFALLKTKPELCREQQQSRRRRRRPDWLRY